MIYIIAYSISQCRSISILYPFFRKIAKMMLKWIEIVFIFYDRITTAFINAQKDDVCLFVIWVLRPFNTQRSFQAEDPTG